ncbi:MAG TPA: AraD1 family protein [Burkholderiaceae bacterium]|nr:AraD1 family protein [Burkholderiaceae bacterium]
MTTRLLQWRSSDGERRVAATRGGTARSLEGVKSVYDLAREAIHSRTPLEQLVARRHGSGTELDLARLLADGAVLPPIDHPDSARLWLTGTGLTHLGSAEARDRMHARALASDASDSLKMFRLGLEGGKPQGDGPGVQPEWFFKGDGSALVAPEAPLPSPAFALDGGEEPEVAGVYLIGDDGTPYRLGFSLANEFSDHVMERQNYLYLAHSKLRPAAIGPELLLGELPAGIEGTTRIRRGEAVLWEKHFLTGEDNMSHHVRNLEYHHFKYAMFRRPGDVHIHFFGTATLSFADGVRTREGDVFEIEAPPFGLPLRNPLRAAPALPVRIEQL